MALEPIMIFPEHQQQSNDHILNARVRLATESDVPFINKLIHKMAEYYNLAHECEDTETSLFAALFNSKHQPLSNPFSSTVSVFLIEVSPTALPVPPHQNCRAIDLAGHKFEPDTIHKTVHVNHLINDPEESLFRTEKGTIIAGFVIFFSSYSTFLTKPGIHMEDLFVRKGYRGMGFGKLLMKAVANLTVRLGYARMEWTVITWNVDSHRFYEKLGAHILKDWRIFRLDGDSLLSFGQLNN
ncbi:L-ornithine N5-acetyltransferase NATA1-like [Chenopodium quinoa]|uniref:N-acetyltransferase domain-containing protein n=1 Tax=Chenopodium quinoa TaxID=63459 RepID=A0A803M3X5_CHEQI|nr:L-ornithine N5-acetyltransferase NATA1-like [Chenopodium quinoa]